MNRIPAIRCMPALLLIFGMTACALQHPPAPQPPPWRTLQEPPLVSQASMITSPAAPPLQTMSVRRTPTAAPPAAAVGLRPDHPTQYTVGLGDTLMEVAEVFLTEPWRWPDVWQPNLEREDPYAIYPGEIIALRYINGVPRLTVLPGTGGIVKLSPRIRVQPLVQPIPTVPRDAISSFLKQVVVAEQANWEEAPAILTSADGRIAIGARDQFYVQGIEDAPRGTTYRVFHPEGEYRDPTTGEILGFGGSYVGEAILDQSGEPATLTLVTARREARRGDRLLPPADEPDVFTFIPSPAPSDLEGRIISVLGSSLNADQYQTLLLNRGSEQGLQPGHMVAIFSAGRTLPATGWRVISREVTTLPSTRSGLAMVYKVYETVSLALVTTAQQPIRTGDRIAAP